MNMLFASFNNYTLLNHIFCKYVSYDQQDLHICYKLNHNLQLK